MPQGQVKPGTKRRKTCNVGRHGVLVEVSGSPGLLLCQTCGHYLGDEMGVTNYGPDRPMLPAA